MKISIVRNFDVSFNCWDEFKYGMVYKLTRRLANSGQSSNSSLWQRSWRGITKGTPKPTDYFQARVGCS